MATTYNTYPDLLIDGGRLAATVWQAASTSEAIAATIRRDATAIVLRATDSTGTRLVGLAPGGLG
jgi:hypothetical protein